MSVNTAKKISQGYKRDWVKRDINSFKGRKTIIKYNQFRMQNQSERITEDQVKELAQTYRANAQAPELTVKRFLNNETVKEYANKELAKILSDNDITLQYVVDKRKEILNKSIENKQYSASIKALEGLESHLGLQNKVKIIEKQQISGNLEGINETISQVKAERKQVTERNEEKQANDKEQ